MEEIWKVVPEYPFMEASSLGRLRRCASHHHKAKIGHIYSQILWTHPHDGNPQYYRVSTDNNGTYVHTGVHRLVCSAFHGPAPTARHQAAHKDGDSLRNTPDNLYWATPQENIADKKKHGRHICGERTPWSVLKEIDIPIIRAAITSRRTMVSIAAEYGVTVSAIQKIKARKSWKHVA